MHTVRVNLGPRSYDIALTTADPAGVGAFARSCLPRSTLALVASDGNTEPHGRAVETSLYRYSSRSLSGGTYRVPTAPRCRRRARSRAGPG